MTPNTNSSPTENLETITDSPVKGTRLTDFENLKDTVRNNPFVEKLKNTQDDTLIGLQKPPLGMKKSYSFQVDSKSDGKNVMDILRNFDSKQKTEKTIFTSKVFEKVPLKESAKPLVKEPVKPLVKQEVLQEPSLQRMGSVSDKRRLFEKSIPETGVKQIQKNLAQVKKNSEIVPKTVVDVEASTTIAERTKSFEVPIETNTLSRSMSIVERRKLFQQKDTKAVLPPAGQWSLKSHVAKNKVELVAEVPKVEKPVQIQNIEEKVKVKSETSKAVPDVSSSSETPKAVTNLSPCSANTSKSAVSSIINRFQTQPEKVEKKPIEIKKTSSVSHMIFQVEHPIATETEMESKRSDSGAFVNDLETSLMGSTLDIPKIDIGSIFDEQDSWMTSLLSSDVTEEQEVIKVQPLVKPAVNVEAIAKPVVKVEPIEAKIEPKKEVLKEVNVAKEEPLTKAIAEKTAKEPVKEKKKKSVSFGTSWDGGLADVRYIGNDTNADEPDEAKGRLLLKFSSVDDLFLNHRASTRTIDFEVSQGNICITSSPISINPNFTTRDMDWECTIPLVSNLPIHFTMNIRDIPQEEKMGGLKRSQSMKNMKNSLRSFGTRLFNKEPVHRFEPPNRTMPMKHSDSVASFNSIASLGFQLEQASQANSNIQLKIAQCTIIDVNDWTRSLNRIETRTLEFYQTEWDHSKKKLFSKSSGIEMLGKVNVQAIFLESQDDYGTDLLPLSISDYKSDISTLGLYKKVWKEGFLHQKGGDCDVWKRRFFKLRGNCLIAHHETTLEQRFEIQLRELERVHYLTDESEDLGETEFVLEFRDGRTISFQLQESQGDEFERDEWIQRIEESHEILSKNPVPAWTIV